MTWIEFTEGEIRYNIQHWTWIHDNCLLCVSTNVCCFQYLDDNNQEMEFHKIHNSYNEFFVHFATFKFLFFFTTPNFKILRIFGSLTSFTYFPQFCIFFFIYFYLKFFFVGRNSQALNLLKYFLLSFDVFFLLFSPFYVLFGRKKKSRCCFCCFAGVHG